MKETPILFTGAMVRAILSGRKTQTRRVVMPQPKRSHWIAETRTFTKRTAFFDFFSDAKIYGHVRCPYGEIGDRLWVKETHYRYGKWEKNGKGKTGRQKWRFRPYWPSSPRSGLRYVHQPPPNDFELPPGRGEGWHKRPSIFMPKWAVRIWLEVVNLRVERLDDITVGDAHAEGMAGALSIEQYQDLWDSINAKRAGGIFAWAKNPWVWVVEFKKVEKGL